MIVSSHVLISIVALAGHLHTTPQPSHVTGHAGENLAKLYPATISHSNQGLFPVCTADDVWKLKSFEFEFGKDLKIACKKATVALGHHGSNVLWAVVFPEDPPQIESVQAGDGEHARSIFLRFAPSDLGRVFPTKTVVERGSPWLRAEAFRIARHKVVWKWCTSAGNPTVVPAGWFLVDIDTEEGPRRFYGVNTNAGAMEYLPEYEKEPMPALTPIEKEDALAAYDEVWETFDREYAGFVLLPEVDWKKLGENYRKEVGSQDTTHATAAVIADLLAHLEDLHVWVKAGDDWLPGYDRDRPLNANWNASHALANATQKGGDNLMWGRTDDDIGYLNVSGLNDAALPEHVDSALEQLGDTWGLVIDLRFNGGGDETLARDIAGRFVDEERIYSLNQYRDGPAHDDLGKRLERRFAPRGPWRYEAPVIALTGQRTLSSAESMALMLAQCPQVTTLGDRTAGSSANPRRLELACGIVVNVPRWLDMDPEGNPIEHVGIAPDVAIETEPDDFSDTDDPVLAAAFARLRKISKRDRSPGRGQ